jgi:hypothetical protein
MAEELLNCPNVITPFQKIRRKGMPKGMAGGAFGWSGFSDRTKDCFLNDGFMGDMVEPLPTRISPLNLLPGFQPSSSSTSSKIISGSRRMKTAAFPSNGM